MPPRDRNAVRTPGVRLGFPDLSGSIKAALQAGQGGGMRQHGGESFAWRSLDCVSGRFPWLASPVPDSLRWELVARYQRYQ